eukprot:gene11703-11848_t
MPAGNGDSTSCSAEQLVAQAQLDIDDFLLQLPLGTDLQSAELEAAIADKLLDLHLANIQLRQRLSNWTHVAHELQELVQQQQEEIQQTNQLMQLEAANAELRQQLQGATTRLQEMEVAAKRVMEQQALGESLQAVQLAKELDAANTALTEAKASATAAQQDAGRLRRALLDAEIDTQRATVAADTARQKVSDVEAEVAKTRSQLSAARAEAEQTQRRLTAVEAAAASTAAQLLEAQAALSKTSAEAAQANEQLEQRVLAARLDCRGCAERAGQLLEVQQQLRELQAGKRTLELALVHEQQHSRAVQQEVQDCKQELRQARAAASNAEQAREQLHMQLHGIQGCCGSPVVQQRLSPLPSPPMQQQRQAPQLASSSPISAAGLGLGSDVPLLGWAPLSPGWQQQQQGEGLIHQCGRQQLQLQEQGAQLQSLRQQLLDLQLQLSDAQSRADVAQHNLQELQGELAEAKTAAAMAMASAASTGKDAAAKAEQLLQMQHKLLAQASELATAQAQVDKLEAQQKILMGDLREAVDAAAQAGTAQSAAAATADQLHKKVEDLQRQLQNEQQQWQVKEQQLLDSQKQLAQQLAAAEASAAAALQQVSQQHQAQLDALTAGLAADSARRKDTEAHVQALQQRHAEELSQLHIQMKQQQGMQQAAEQRLADQQGDLQETRKKLAAAETTLQKAKDDAVECSAAVAKQQQALRQQLLEAMGKRLAEAKAGQEAAARQAAAAGEKLAMALAAQESIRAQLMAEVAARAGPQWGSGAIGLPPPSPPSPYHRAQVERSSRAIEQLGHQLDEKDAQIAELMAELEHLNAENGQLQQQLQQHVVAASALDRAPPVLEPQPHQGDVLTPQGAAWRVMQLVMVMQQLESRLKQHVAVLEKHSVSSSRAQYLGEAWSSTRAVSHTVDVLSVAATAVAEVCRDLQQLGQDMAQQNSEPTWPGVPDQQQLEDAEPQWQQQEAGVVNDQIRALRQMVYELQSKLEAAESAVAMFSEAAAATAVAGTTQPGQATDKERAQVEAELRFLQRQFEEVTGELREKQELLAAKQTEVDLLAQQLATAETAASRHLEELQDIMRQSEAAADGQTAARDTAVGAPDQGRIERLLRVRSGRQSASFDLTTTTIASNFVERQEQQQQHHAQSIRHSSSLTSASTPDKLASAAHSAGASRAMSRTSSSRAFADAAAAAAAAPLAFLDSSDEEDEHSGSAAGTRNRLASSRASHVDGDSGPEPAGRPASSSRQSQHGPMRAGDSRAKLLAVSGGGYNAEKLQRSLSMVSSHRQSRVQGEMDASYTEGVPRRRHLSEQGVQLAAQAAAAADTVAVARKHELVTPTSVKEVQRAACGSVGHSSDHIDSSSTGVRRSLKTSVSFKEPAVQGLDSSSRHRRSTEGSARGLGWVPDNRRQQAAMAQAAHMLASDSD